LNWTDASPAAYLIQAWAIAGTGVNVARRSLTAGNVDITTSYNTTFAPTQAIAASAWTSVEDVVEAGADFGFGFGNRETSGAAIPYEWAQARLNWSHADGLAASAPAAQIGNGEIVATNTAGDGTLRASVRMIAQSSSGRTLGFQVLRNNINRSFNCLLIGMGSVPGGMTAVTTPTATGAQEVHESDFTGAAGALFGIVSQATNEGAMAGAPAGSMGIYLGDGTHDFTVSWFDESGAATTNSGSYVSTALTAITHTGAELEEATVAFETGGAELTYTTVSGLARYWPLMMLMFGSTPTTPIADFAADVTSAQVDDTITFTDLSSGNGDTITAWAWDFGDGGASASQNPTHVYTADGTYTVALTVTTSTGTDTETKSNYISIAGAQPPSRVIIHGPHIPLDVDETTDNAIGLYTTDANAATHTHRHRPRTVRFRAEAPAGLPPAGFYDLYLDQASRNLYVIFPDGGKVAFTGTYTAGSGTGGGGEPPTGGTFNGQVLSSSDDAQQATATVTTTGLSIGITAGTRYGGLRFQNVTIPPGATITNAYLQLYVVTVDDPADMDWWCEKVANSTTFVAEDNNISGRTLTTATYNWTATNTGTGAYVDTPDLSALVQEVVNLPTWQSGNALTFITQGSATSELNFRTYDHSAEASAPKLVVEYTI
jgi:PKD repeat protein